MPEAVRHPYRRCSTIMLKYFDVFFLDSIALDSHHLIIGPLYIMHL